MATIENNGADVDEITASGFTIERPYSIQAPRIAECLINLECQMTWERPLSEESRWHVFAGKVVHLAMDDATFELESQARLQTLQTMYNLRSTLNPLTGKAGASGLPVLGERTSSD
jgi:flavin reductase (DIM6/NTAB) family NADH-FMN oxidoreductase RutF